MADFDDGGKRSRTPYLSAEERYSRDPAFHTIVDMMVCAVDQLQLTPTELREAAVYACVRFEHMNMRSISATLGQRLPDRERLRAISAAEECERRARQLSTWLKG